MQEETHKSDPISLEDVISVGIFLTLIFTVLVQVVSRYLFRSAIPWTEELARYQLILLTFIGSAIAVRKNIHVSLDFLLAKLPPGALRVVRISAGLLECTFYGFTSWISFRMMLFSWHRYMVTVHISRAFIYGFVTAGFLLMLLRACQRLWLNFSGPRSTEIIHPD